MFWVAIEHNNILVTHQQSWTNHIINILSICYDSRHTITYKQECHLAFAHVHVYFMPPFCNEMRQSALSQQRLYPQQVSGPWFRAIDLDHMTESCVYARYAKSPFRRQHLSPWLPLQTFHWQTQCPDENSIGHYTMIDLPMSWSTYTLIANIHLPQWSVPSWSWSSWLICTKQWNCPNMDLTWYHEAHQTSPQIVPHL